ISLEMIYRGLYHFSVAYQKGKATDPVKYFSAPENQDLGIVKRQRKPFVKLIVAPFPDKQQGNSEFFFQASSIVPLTTALQP
ncbi:IS4 family transposase, partial [cyanobacterium TDX16]